MRVAGATELAVPAAALRTALGDPERLVAALPHVDALGWDAAEDGSFTATIRPAIALGEIPVRTRWTPVRAGDPAVLRYRVEGRTDEHALALDAIVATTAGDGVTMVTWAVELHLTGTLRSAGQRVLEAIVARQVQLVLEAAARQAAASPA